MPRAFSTNISLTRLTACQPICCSLEGLELATRASFGVLGYSKQHCLFCGLGLANQYVVCFGVWELLPRIFWTEASFSKRGPKSAKTVSKQAAESQNPEGFMSQTAGAKVKDRRAQIQQQAELANANHVPKTLNPKTQVSLGMLGAEG